MTYDEQTALRLVRAVVDDGTSQFVPPLRRDVLRRLLAAIDMLKRENATLRQKQGTPHFSEEHAPCP